MHKQSQESRKLIELFEQRNKILRVIGEASTNYKAETTKDEILELCCNILVENNNFCLVWAGKREPLEKDITPIAAMSSVKEGDRDCMKLIEQVVLEMHSSNPAAQALKTGTPVIIRDVFEEKDLIGLQRVATQTGFRSCSSWPLRYKKHEYGVLCIHSEDRGCFDEVEVDFLSNIITDISLALYSLETTMRLQVERDFNQEIVDTVQALMVSIAPCGQILSFNAEAERITGYTQKQAKGKYWVDILLSPRHRKKQQQQMSEALKGEGRGISFQASLETKDGQEHIINWHSSIRSEITGQVGLVLFGLDITEQLQAGHARDRALDQFRNIFSVIQDPALIVSRDNRIMDANLATFCAARKTRDEVIGQKVCKILHGGRRDKAVCPLEALVSLGKSRIMKTELRGLNGRYMLTISPLSSGDDQAALLVARDLTEEELLQSEAMQTVYSLIENVGRVDTTVLITGDSGTGKELAAEALHLESHRKNKPLVKVDCTAIPEDLLESELFGHRKGAFTGADRDRLGRILQADGGTLFLDEIGNISTMVQLRLLRFLQEKTFYPVGCDTPIQVDVRVVTATNINLRTLVEQGDFREDLYFRLRVIDIMLPPLREREGDVMLLANYFIAGIAEKIGKEITGISDQVLLQLARYPWPGNVRELEHILERACVLCSGTTITSSQLPVEITSYQQVVPEQVGLQNKYTMVPASRGLGQTFGAQDPENLSPKNRILQALQRSGGNKAKAARFLGIDRSTLYRKIKDLQIDLSVLDL